PGPPSPSLPGTYVSIDQLDLCPVLTPRWPPPKSAKDVRPDDFKVIMSIGDSITAGLVARPYPDDPEAAHDMQIPHSPRKGKLFIWEEYRGLSYATGMDDDAISLAKIISHYSPELVGGSIGHHPPVSCAAKACHPDTDGLNAAVSGSVAANLLSQVDEYLIPAITSLRLGDEWKYLNLGIGANDLCAFCLSPNMTQYSVSRTPQQFAHDIKHAVEHLRSHVRNVIVNIVGLFRVSTIYKLTRKDPYCQGPLLPAIPHLPVECSCALLPGPAGDYTRQRMDELGEAYDTAVLEVIREWEQEDDPTFAAIWQPGSAIDLEHWPIEALSPVDCFHPSEETHRRVAAGLWNRLTLSLDDKARPIYWEDIIKVRCLQEEDTIRVGEIGD
ncbi:hypothetical protein TREMEDRAFT_15851, partial [Tremella mesenterica DSM 1558]|uniref:uncharacterized protein n=1 Tax=Tremella mesenterica (strain ATCC 24925 / CBS 8224 / DSM 1558 / NBRC 9311 / NRRL Y-6157 / RJB 2259-6 / UBC 559-6) TaxID=578456 RepID=UPI0003F49EA3